MKGELDVKVAEAYAAGAPGSGRPLADSDWIVRFRGSPSSMRLVAEALENNKDLKIAAARMRAAEATADLAGVDRKPKLDGGFEWFPFQAQFHRLSFWWRRGEEAVATRAVCSAVSPTTSGSRSILNWET